MFGGTIMKNVLFISPAFKDTKNGNGPLKDILENFRLEKNEFPFDHIVLFITGNYLNLEKTNKTYSTIVNNYISKLNKKVTLQIEKDNIANLKDFNTVQYLLNKFEYIINHLNNISISQNPIIYFAASSGMVILDLASLTFVNNFRKKYYLRLVQTFSKFHDLEEKVNVKKIFESLDFNKQNKEQFSIVDFNFTNKVNKNLKSANVKLIENYSYNALYLKITNDEKLLKNVELISLAKFGYYLATKKFQTLYNLRKNYSFFPSNVKEKYSILDKTSFAILTQTLSIYLGVVRHDNFQCLALIEATFKEALCLALIAYSPDLSFNNYFIFGRDVNKKLKIFNSETKLAYKKLQSNYELYDLVKKYAIGFKEKNQLLTSKLLIGFINYYLTNSNPQLVQIINQAFEAYNNGIYRNLNNYTHRSDFILDEEVYSNVFDILIAILDILKGIYTEKDLFNDEILEVKDFEPLILTNYNKKLVDLIEKIEK